MVPVPNARQGPTFREAVLMHAVARLVLHPLITNIQASWVKMGLQGLQACLASGANDLGGSLMNETITRAAEPLMPTVNTSLQAKRGALATKSFSKLIEV